MCVGGPVVGLLSAQVCVMGAGIRCLWCGSRKWLRVLFAGNSVAYCERSFRVENHQCLRSSVG